MLRLAVQNWMCHERLELEFASPVNLVVSQNMAGKTALRDAVEFAISGTGMLRGITTKKELALLSIRDDASECVVDLTVSDGERELFHVERSMNRAGTQKLEVSYAGHEAQVEKLREAQEAIWNVLEMNEGQLRAVLAAESLFVLSPADRRTLIGSVMGGQGIEPEELLDQLTRRGIDQADAQEFGSMVISTGWRKAQETAEKRRAEAKAGLKALGTRSEPDYRFQPPWREEPLDLRSFDVSDVEGRLTIVREQLAKHQAGAARDLGAIEGQLKAKEAQQEDLRREVELLEADPDVDIGRREENHRLAQEGLKQAERAVRDQVDAIVALEKEAGVSVHQDQLSRPDPCPVIPGGPKCPMTPKKLEAHAAALKDRVELIGHKLDAARDSLGNANELVKVKESQLRTANEQLQAATHRRDRITGHTAALSTLEDEIERLCKELADAKDAPDPGDGAFLRNRVSQGEQTLEAKQRFDLEMGLASTHDERTKTYQADVGRWDRVAQALKPDQVEAVFTERAAGTVRESLERFGKRFGGIRLTSEMAVELYWEGRWRRYQQLSESGRLRIGYAVQYAFAVACGFPLLVLDQIDHLDQDGKWALLETLRDISPEFSSVLGLATLQREAPSAAPFENVATYYLHDGFVGRVK
jgi:hypothetical protein